jgi:membrane protease YdiL (CAAX protease family)
LSRPQRIAVFYVPTFLLTHALVGAYLAAGGSFHRLDSFGLANLAMLVPGSVSAVVAKWVYREPVREVLGLHLSRSPWLLVAWWLPLVIVLASLGIGLLMPGTSFSPTLTGLSEHYELTPDQLAMAARAMGPVTPPWTLLLQGLVLGPTLCAVAGLGEEAGWRGLLHHELRGLGFWKESALVGLLWGLWHVPLAFEGYGYPHHPWAGAAFLLLGTQLLSPLYLLVRERSGTVFGAALLHGSFSGLSLFAIGPIAHGDELLVGLFGVAGLLAIAIADVTVFALVGAQRGN